MKRVSKKIADPTWRTQRERQMDVPLADKIFIDQKDVAALLSVCEASIRNLIKKKDFPKPVGLFGRNKRWSRVAVEAWCNRVIAESTAAAR